MGGSIVCPCFVPPRIPHRAGWEAGFPTVTLTKVRQSIWCRENHQHSSHFTAPLEVGCHCPSLTLSTFLLCVRISEPSDHVTCKSIVPWFLYCSYVSMPSAGHCPKCTSKQAKQNSTCLVASGGSSFLRNLPYYFLFSPGATALSFILISPSKSTS